ARLEPCLFRLGPRASGRSSREFHPMEHTKAPSARRTREFDSIDRKILALLEADARRTIAEIAREVDLTGPATAERVARMRDTGIIEGFTVRLDPRKLGLQVSAVIEFTPNS